ncbi:MAG: hypothetical protein ABI593_13250 [Betaproteobacteria bacterium]
MRTRIIHAALLFFGIAGAFALAVIVFAPIGGMRTVGAAALSCAFAGLGLQLYALREADPHAFMVLRYRMSEPLVGVTRRWSAQVRRGVRARVAEAVPASPIASALR